MRICFLIALLSLGFSQSTIAWESAPARDISYGEPIFAIWPAISTKDFNSHQRIERKVSYGGREYLSEAAVVMPSGDVYLQLQTRERVAVGIKVFALRVQYLYLKIGKSSRFENGQRIQFDGIDRVLYQIDRPKKISTEIRSSIEGSSVHRTTRDVFTRPDFKEIRVVLKSGLGNPISAKRLQGSLSTEEAERLSIASYNDAKVIEKSKDHSTPGFEVTSYWNEIVTFSSPWTIDEEPLQFFLGDRWNFETEFSDREFSHPKIRPVLLDHALAVSEKSIPDPRVYLVLNSFLDRKLAPRSILDWFRTQHQYHPLMGAQADQPGLEVRRSRSNRFLESIMEACRRFKS